MRANAFLAAGDKTVIDMFDSDVYRSIKAPEVKAFFNDQIACETIHQISYSKILELCDSNEYLKYLCSDDFINAISYPLSKFNSYLRSKKYNENLSIMVFVSMCTERLMFCVSFAINMFVGALGYGNKIAEITRTVMRDENLHYQHARGLLFLNLEKIEKIELNTISIAFRTTMHEVLYRLFVLNWDNRSNAVKNDKRMADVEMKKRMSYLKSSDYFDYEYYNMLYETGLLKKLPKRIAKMRDHDFSFMFMNLNEQESASNLMESTSTNYATEGTL
ncbi:ribonucleoside-diphosphate reductase small chain A-like [Melanaphis sacchari]|uniref:Ribonucleoside-diphosphate reductase small chain A n=1 Tax=Melanaphis sacchari TaxID=742174 RepID=A0A2H8THP1_9HEMI|nr:ribonucleoside-diphosphate reductase small chain A-like [Melanaphis sacchari]